MCVSRCEHKIYLQDGEVEGFLGLGLGLGSFGSTEFGFLGQRNFDAGIAAARSFRHKNFARAERTAARGTAKGRESSSESA